jgi:hypothetical protein
VPSETRTCKKWSQKKAQRINLRRSGYCRDSIRSSSLVPHTGFKPRSAIVFGFLWEGSLFRLTFYRPSLPLALDGIGEQGIDMSGIDISVEDIGPGTVRNKPDIAAGVLGGATVNCRRLDMIRRKRVVG